ncbi:MAG: carboxypeptidase regulatory-like domain-containing protein [Kofleriaceae bacterium]
MRRGIASFLAVVVGAPLAWAQSAPADVVDSTEPVVEEGPSPVIGYGALPGGLWAPSAESLPKGAVQVALLGGYGMRNDLIGTNTKFTRSTGRLAVGFAPHELISIAVSLDGRFDQHSGDAMGTDDDGYVGDPHLLIRAAKTSGNLSFGGQVDLWVPGKDAPSVAGSAISVAASGLVSLTAGPGLLSFNAGFRVDNSAKSVDSPTLLSVQDRVSLGVSEFNAFVGGAHLGIPVGKKAYVAAEGQIDVFVGSGITPMGASAAHEAPSPLVRFGASGGYHINKSWTVLAYLGGARVPKVTNADIAANDVKLVPYEPTFSFGVGIQGRFGGPSTTVKKRVDPQEIDVPIFASVEGELLDEAGAPAVGAKVVVKTSTYEGTGVTDDKGAWKVEKLPIGKTVKGVDNITDPVGEVTIDVSGKKPVKLTVNLKPGVNKADRISLEPVLPPGQLRAVVRNANTGKPIGGATVKIEPGGLTATSGADGQFSVDLQPGIYKITASSPGLQDQELDVTIDPNGVAIKIIELR